jgi:predicted metal-dependent hydrolase
MLVQLGDYDIEVLIEKKNNKNVYFRFKEDGKLHVTCNRFVTESMVKKMIKENEKSLLKMYIHSEHRNEINNHFYYLGDPYTKVIDETVKKVYIEDDYIYTKNDKMLDKWYKEECLKIFTERVNRCLEMFNDVPEFSLKVRTMKTRWGVNNVTKRIITLNSELLKKDVTLIDYVIIHEICHFYEANHSSRFWAQVEKRYPYYKLARKRLRVE